MPTVQHSALSFTELHEPSSYMITSLLDDISTASTIYVPIPYAGTVAKVITVIAGAFSTANDTIDVKNSAGSSMGTLTITQSGSAAGDVDTLAPSTNNTVTADDFITVETNGASTDTTKLWFTVVIDRSA